MDISVPRFRPSPRETLGCCEIDFGAGFDQINLIMLSIARIARFWRRVHRIHSFTRSHNPYPCLDLTANSSGNDKLLGIPWDGVQHGFHSHGVRGVFCSLGYNSMRCSSTRCSSMTCSSMTCSSLTCSTMACSNLTCNSMACNACHSQGSNGMGQLQSAQ